MCGIMRITFRGLCSKILTTPKSRGMNETIPPLYSTNEAHKATDGVGRVALCYNHYHTKKKTRGHEANLAGYRGVTRIFLITGS